MTKEIGLFEEDDISEITQTLETITDEPSGISTAASFDRKEPLIGALGFVTEPNVTDDEDENEIKREASRQIVKVANTVKYDLDITKMWKKAEEIFKTELTDEERAQGFRLSRTPDPKYLTFVPGKGDKRRYLTALPLNGPVPEPSYRPSVPVSSAQRWMFLSFWVFCAGATVMATFLIRNSITA